MVERSIRISAFALVLAYAAIALCGEPPAAPILPSPDTFKAYDRPSDDGSAIGVEWEVVPGNSENITYILEISITEDFSGEVKNMRVPVGSNLKSKQKKYYGSSKKNESLHYIEVLPADAKLFPPEKRKVKQPKKDASALEMARYSYERKEENNRFKGAKREVNRDTECYFRLSATNGTDTVFLEDGGVRKVISARATPNLFAWYRCNNLIPALIFSCVVMGFIRLARRNPDIFIRRIAGLDAVDEALGRATEMGRSIFFVHGLAEIGSLATIAAVNILGQLCRQVAIYDSRVKVMNSTPMTMAVSQEVVKQAYTEAGRPDAYDPDDIALVAPDQFTYVAAVGGRMVRERPAAIFMIGSFAAESLILAETGASTGAIQIAGTDAYTQLPFFITTCDYTLIGEELYAASAYLSREPRLLGSLRGQDIGKIVLMAVLLLGTVAITLGTLLVASDAANQKEVGEFLLRLRDIIEPFV